MDISSHGAKVVVQIPSDVPARFELSFLQNDRKRRICEVIWRRGKMLGVKFTAVSAAKTKEPFRRCSAWHGFSPPSSSWPSRHNRAIGIAAFTL
jgi:PilZ domain